jgi:hypothetical protein
MEKDMRPLLLAGTAALAVAVAGSAVWAASNDTGQASRQTLKSSLTEMLQKSGYTDIRVAPAAFVVRAKDQNGNPVVMSISPDEFAEVSVTGATTGNAAMNGGTYVNVPQRDDLGSKLIGLDVYNDGNKDIGTIKDIALNPGGRATAYILSVGGFLGIGDHYVAVNPSAVKVTYSDADKKWHASMNATADQLKAAPEFKYTGKWSSTRT